MSVNILGTSCDQGRSTVQWSFTSTETRRFVRTDSPGRPPWLSHSFFAWLFSFGIDWFIVFNQRCLIILISYTVQVYHSGFWGGDWGVGMNVNQLFCTSRTGSLLRFHMQCVDSLFLMCSLRKGTSSTSWRPLQEDMAVVQCVAWWVASLCPTWRCSVCRSITNLDASHIKTPVSPNLAPLKTSWLGLDWRYVHSYWNCQFLYF